MNIHADPQETNCPFLGLPDDDQSLMAYTSPYNCCHHCAPVVPIRLDHQNEYCLDASHLKCPAYKQKPGQPLPKDLRYKVVRQFPGQEHLRNLMVAGAMLVLALLGALIAWLNLPGRYILSAETPAAQATPSVITADAYSTVSVAPLPMTELAVPASTSAPSASMLPSAPPVTVTLDASSPTASSPLVLKHSLETPLGRGPFFIIHRILSGENLDTLAKKYSTSVEAIAAVNYSLTIPIWAESLIVIPLDVTDAANLPIFEPYQVMEDQITPEMLAAQLAFDLQRFIEYNDLSEGEPLQAGGWFLIPRVSYQSP